LKAQPLERDAVKAIRWEVHDPIYRVDFWHQLPPPPGVRPEMMGYKQDVYRLSDVETFNDVRAWAEANANRRTFVIYAEIIRGTERGIIRLDGTDPTR
jgi:hypothetical protein